MDREVSALGAVLWGYSIIEDDSEHSRLVSHLQRPSHIKSERGFPSGTVVKNPPATAGDVGLIPRLGRFLEKEIATHSSIPAWKVPGTEEPGGLQSIHGGHKKRRDLATKQKQQQGKTSGA